MSVTDILNEEMARQEVWSEEKIREGYKTTMQAVNENLYGPSTWSPTMRWYHQGALGAYIMRKIRAVTGSVSEALSMMRG